MFTYLIYKVLHIYVFNEKASLIWDSEKNQWFLFGFYEDGQMWRTEPKCARNQLEAIARAIRYLFF
jgi:hypothetical protein